MSSNTDLGQLIEKSLREEKKFEGKIFQVSVHEVLLPDGSHSEREIVKHRGGVGILALAENGDIVLVRQYRLAMGAMVLEIPAGKIEADEKPLDCAKRELLEETGLTAKDWLLLAEAYPSPGYTTERLQVFLARTLEESAPSLDEGEFLQSERMPLSEALRLLTAGEIRDAKTMIALLLLERRLRENGSAYGF